jgi:hypothetical protein
MKERSRRWLRGAAGALAALGLYVGSLFLVDRFAFLGLPVPLAIVMRTVLALGTLALVGPDRSWRAYAVAGAASSAWAVVGALLPEPPGWWVLLIGSWLAGALAIVLGTCAMLVRLTVRPRLSQVVSLALWLVVPFGPVAYLADWVITGRLSDELQAGAVAGWWFFGPPVVLIVWLASEVMVAQRAGNR